MTKCCKSDNGLRQTYKMIVKHEMYINNVRSYNNTVLPTLHNECFCFV